MKKLPKHPEWQWVLRSPAPLPEKLQAPHKCKLPGWWDRRRRKIREGDIIRCTKCRTRWIWGWVRWQGWNWYEEEEYLSEMELEALL